MIQGKGGGSSAKIRPPKGPTQSGQSSIIPRDIYLLPSERPDRPAFDLREWLKAYPCNLPYTLLAFLKHDGHDTSDFTRSQRYRRRLLHSLKSLQNAGVIDLWRGDDALLQWRLTQYGLNLIRCTHYSNFPENPPIGIYSLPRRVRKERYRALAITARHRLLDKEQRFQISQQFDTYMDDVRDRSVILCHKEDSLNPEAPLYFLPYKTRFTDAGRKQDNLKTYEGIWDHSLTRYQSAVFLTLTTDPKMHRSSYHANKHFQVALNRFFSLIQKRLGYRPKYVNVHEFTERGLLHAHIVIFGLNYLEHQARLSLDWQNCGQGSIVYVYGLRNNGQKWTWTRAKPANANKGKTVDAYLKKYLKKALFGSEELELYWTFNKRFFTYSKALRPARAQTRPFGPRYHFIGSARSDEISVVLERRSRILWYQHRRAAAATAAGPPSW